MALALAMLRTVLLVALLALAGRWAVAVFAGRGREENFVYRLFSLVAEAAVVGRPDDLTGEAVCAFVVLKQARPTDAQAPAIAKQLRDWVAKEIGPIAKPKDIRFGDNLPKTRSGKIMRRLLRSIAKGEAITQDISTLENPAILEQLAKPLV